MNRVLTFLKSYWPHMVLAVWCSWATVKLNQIESRMAVAGDLTDLEAMSRQTMIDVGDMKKAAEQEQRLRLMSPPRRLP